MTAAEDDASPTRRSVPSIAVWAICFVAVVSVVSWRRDVIFSGDIDAVVITKAALALLALTAAIVVALRTRPRRPVGGQTAFLLALTLGISAIGALAAGSPIPSLIVIGRVVMLAGIVLALLAAADWRTVLGGFLGALGIVAVVAAITGISRIDDEGRLVGGIPEVAANELAGLAAPPLIGLIVLLIRDGLRLRTGIPAIALGVVIWATESRTGLIAIALAIIVAFIAAPRVHWSVTAAVFVSLPIGYALTVYTPIVSDFLVRGQSVADISSLSARTDAWRVVFSWNLESWERWLGLGLAVKQVPVPLKDRELQVLDSSWVSVLAQTGIIGVLLVIAILLPMIVRAFTVADHRPLVLPLLTLILVRGFTESGIIDSSATFLLFFTIAVALEPGTRRDPVPELPRPDFRGAGFARAFLPATLVPTR
jgi:hypothetical protein